MATAITAYTQADLDADIVAITDSIESVIDRIGRIKDNWAQVQVLHPGVTAVDYIRDHVPYLHGNTAAAVALVEAGTTTVRDAARLTGRAHSTVVEAVQKTSVGNPTNHPKPTTLATGKTAPGPAVGTTTKEVPVKEKPTLIATPLVGVTQPVAPTPSPLATDAYNLLKQVAELDVSAIRMATTAHQHRRLMKVAARAEKVCAALGVPMITFP